MDSPFADLMLSPTIIRLVEDNNSATIDKVLLSILPGAVYHNGGWIKIGPDGKLTGVKCFTAVGLR